MEIIERFVNSFLFWAAWIVIPLIMEVLPSIGSFFILIKRKIASGKVKKPILYPEISIIVPVYNSQDTLEACIKSINDSIYPNDRIRVFLVNNQGKDNSFSVFTQCQKKYPDLLMQWLNAEQGKSRALNLALYNSQGKYIIHIDSDGILEPSALTHMVDKFEEDSSVNCMTGAIMIQPELVEEYPKGMSRLLRKLEFLEYAQAFLAGRNYASDLDSIYTISGAFSGFRKSVILKSRLYNTETLAEDTHITFQMRYIQKEKIRISEKSIFFVDPIESVDKLYTQRQRWQRGSLEVSKMFLGDKMKTRKALSDVNVKTLLYDHTFAFPRLIWYFALICLTFVGYSGKMVLLASVFLIALYTLCGYLYFFSVAGFLSDFKDVCRYYKKQWFLVPLLPLFNLVVFFIRMAGIINSINTDSAWKTRTLSDETGAFSDILKKDFSKFGAKLAAVRDKVNDDPENIYAPKTLLEKTKCSPGWYIAVIFFSMFSVVLMVVCRWAKGALCVGLNEIINTLLGPMEGAGSDLLNAGLAACLPPVIGFVLLIVFLVWFDRRKTKKVLSETDLFLRDKKAGRIVWVRRIFTALTCFLVVASAVFANACYDVVGYVSAQINNSSLYEKYYVDPDSVEITADGTPKNIIYIYLESMETTYASKKAGGFNKKNYIPNLTKLAEENVSFSNHDKLGGFYANYGATWTMAAMYTTSSGVPYALTADITKTKDKIYASGLTTLGDVLKEKGYRSEFLCGSDAAFGGRKLFLTQHGDYEMFDYYTAMEKGYIPKGYYEWWGFEDEILYRIARDEATRLSQQGQPFNLTILTVDTHATDGYVCNLCKDTYPQKAANVVTCADQQLGDFIDWCSQQPFFENTAIVITGDHPRMDTALVEDVDWYDRTIYNCFINAAPEGKIVTKNRECTSLDIFPTVLAAMGFEIEGDRLGLGVNLFSNQRTLVETLGIDSLEKQLRIRSDYYISNFAPELLGLEE